MSARALPWAVTAGASLLMLAPLFRSPPTDSFPLSTYPMFSYGRRDAMTTVERAVGVGPGGARPLSPPLLGTDEVLQAKATVARSIRLGGRAARQLCQQIAARVAANDALGDIARVQIRTDTFDAIAFLEGREAPVKSRTHAACKVPRP